MQHLFTYEKTSVKRKVRQSGVLALDWQGLYDWTQAQPTGAVLGQSHTNTSDPLGRYLDEKTGMQAGYWSIGPSIRNGYQDCIPKPPWVQSLIEETDHATGDQGAPITREMYLVIVERVKPALTTEIDQRQVLTLIEQARKELDDEYETTVRVVQVWLRQRGVDLDLERVQMCMDIVRSRL